VEKHGWRWQFVESDRRPYAYTVDYMSARCQLCDGPVTAARDSSAEQRRRVFVDDGRPGTGERILVAVNCLLEVVQVQYPDAHMNVAVASTAPTCMHYSCVAR